METCFRLLVLAAVLVALVAGCRAESPSGKRSSKVYYQPTDVQSIVNIIDDEDVATEGSGSSHNPDPDPDVPDVANHSNGTSELFSNPYIPTIV